MESKKELRDKEESSSANDMFDKSHRLNLLIQQINNKFTLQNQSEYLLQATEDSCDLFPFSNEFGWDIIVPQIYGNLPSDTLNVALFFGESNYLSILPELLNYDLIILADINPHLHTHTAFLFKCLLSTNNPKEFINLYEKENPLSDYEGTSLWRLRKDLLGRKEALNEYHFLSSQDRFEACKNTAKEISIVNIYLNLFSIHGCYQLKTTLDEYQAKLQLCNFTNIHQYDLNNYNMVTTIPLLLSSSDKDHLKIIYSELQLMEENKFPAYIGNFHQYCSVVMHPLNEDFIKRKNINEFRRVYRIIDEVLQKEIFVIQKYFPDFPDLGITIDKDRVQFNIDALNKIENLSSDNLEVMSSKKNILDTLEYFMPYIYILKEEITIESISVVNTLEALNFATDAKKWDSNLKKYFAAEKIGFWYRRTKAENIALQSIQEQGIINSSLADSIRTRRN